MVPFALAVNPAMFLPLFAVMNLWYAVPLIVSVSMVCAATRHEEFGPILNHAVRFGFWIAIFMGGVMALLAVINMLA